MYLCGVKVELKQLSDTFNVDCRFFLDFVG